MRTEQVWRDLSKKYNLALEVFAIHESRGRLLAGKYDLNAFPALLIDGRVKAVGAHTADTARKLLKPLIT